MVRPQICLPVQAGRDPSNPGMGPVSLASPRPAGPGMFLLTPQEGNKVPLILVSLSPGIHKIPKPKPWQGHRRSHRNRILHLRRNVRRQRPNDNENISKTRKPRQIKQKTRKCLQGSDSKENTKNKLASHNLKRL